jgi:hypothetical protein
MRERALRCAGPQQIERAAAFRKSRACNVGLLSAQRHGSFAGLLRFLDRGRCLGELLVLGGQLCGQRVISASAKSPCALDSSPKPAKMSETPPPKSENVCGPIVIVLARLLEQF